MDAHRWRWNNRSSIKLRDKLANDLELLFLRQFVQFNKDGIELFLSWHGRQNYSEMDLSEILKAYAYEGTGRSYPFLTVLREPRNRQAGCPRLGIRFARRVSFRIAFIRSGWQDLSMGSTELPDTGEPSMTADFGRIETCSCCGRDVKRPVFSKRLGAHFGRACMDSILATRQAYQFGGLMAATREAMTYKPRTWQTHLAYAIA